MAEVRTGEDQILEEVEVPPATSRVTGEAGLLLTQGVRGKESVSILRKQRGIFFREILVFPITNIYGRIFVESTQLNIIHSLFSDKVVLR